MVKTQSRQSSYLWCFAHQLRTSLYNDMAMASLASTSHPNFVHRIWDSISSGIVSSSPWIGGSRSDQGLMNQKHYDLGGSWRNLALMMSYVVFVWNHSAQNEQYMLKIRMFGGMMRNKIPWFLFEKLMFIGIPCSISLSIISDVWHHGPWVTWDFTALRHVWVPWGLFETTPVKIHESMTYRIA